MLDTALLLTAVYLATGTLFVRRCAFDTRLAGWQGQAAIACAFLVMSAAWPMLAFFSLRSRLRCLLVQCRSGHENKSSGR
jgi:hypothetical protein